MMSRSCEKVSGAGLQRSRPLGSWSDKAALSAHFKVDGASRRVDGDNDYVYYASNSRM